jgi:hypothetical protein
MMGFVLLLVLILIVVWAFNPRAARRVFVGLLFVFIVLPGFCILGLYAFGKLMEPSEREYYAKTHSDPALVSAERLPGGGGISYSPASEPDNRAVRRGGQGRDNQTVVQRTGGRKQ